jgi:hypothetical protein
MMDRKGSVQGYFRSLSLPARQGGTPVIMAKSQRGGNRGRVEVDVRSARRRIEHL